MSAGRCKQGDWRRALDQTDKIVPLSGQAEETNCPRFDASEAPDSSSRIRWNFRQDKPKSRPIYARYSNFCRFASATRTRDSFSTHMGQTLAANKRQALGS
ncbi:hypothetical protein ACVIWV_006477 [Bradyrhizobium diazoefficiens]